jgi:hypothetical protein
MFDDAPKLLQFAHDPAIARQGYLAGRRGLNALANPYHPGTPERRAWLAGLFNGRTKPLRLVRDHESLAPLVEMKASKIE